MVPKPLADMTLEELWHLFPIELVEHRDCWDAWYEEEAAVLADVLPPSAAVSHIGSTAIRGIWAKPIVDILVEARRDDFPQIGRTLLGDGWLCMADEGGRVDFNRGYTPEGFAERVFHLHLRVPGDNDEICFRDYLNAHPDVAKEYEELKLGLWGRFEYDRDAYTQAKTDFVRDVVRRARTR